MQTEDQIIAGIIRREGGYSDRAADRGGATKYGITQATLAAWLGEPVTKDDVRNLSEEDAARIYRERYIDEPGYSGIQFPPLRVLVIDCGVLFGADDASPWLQAAANAEGGQVRIDGQVGPHTLGAVNGTAAHAHRIYARVLMQRIQKHGRVIAADGREVAAGRRDAKKLQALNAGGWLNRCGDLLQEFLEFTK